MRFNEHEHKEVFLTSEAVGHVCFEDDVTEDGGQRQRFVIFISQRDVSVTRLQAVQRQDSLSDQFIVIIVHSHSEDRQVWEDNLSRWHVTRVIFTSHETVNNKHTDDIDPGKKN